MDYRRRKIDIHNRNLFAFIRQLTAGEFLIPTFQRLFIWDPEHVVNLWDSIYRCYPIGSILYWKTQTRLHVHRKLGGFFLPENGDAKRAPRRYVLDGQQRATSLVASFHGGAGKVKEQYAFDFTLYFDLIRAEFFFAKDYYRHRWEADPAFLVRVQDLPGLPANYCDSLTALPGYSESAPAHLEQAKYMFTDYQIPLIRLTGFDVEGVCGIYERINQTGVRLTNMDILIARGFKNYATVVEEDFPIT